MMRILVSTAIISVTFIITGCNNNSSGGRPVQLKSLELTPPATQQISTDSNNQFNKNGNIPIESTGNASTSQGLQTATKLNPAHGQPGHRCDIPVGSPLDSKPTVGTASATTQPTVTNILPTDAQPPQPVAAKAGINPAHGQPGHRCDIPVGSPLDSKPATSPTVIPNPINPGSKK